ncbi:hypothetical protein FACHB389_29330 [Nostoc calcicola FACHB-389]|nr:CopG family transcriptional regulator [Nostoc calcicola FACHB-3891]OKH25711.1 hypothetical protein FACHB389_29330 [Nostoc calcicola FACHB-389]
MGRKTTHGLYGQNKKDFTITLTPEGAEILDSRAKALGISRSELIERIARTHLLSPLERRLLGERLAS